MPLLCVIEVVASKGKKLSRKTLFEAYRNVHGNKWRPLLKTGREFHFYAR